MSIDARTLADVWNATQRLAPVDGSKDAIERLQAVIGWFAAKAATQSAKQPAGPQVVLPAIGAPNWQAVAHMATVLENALAFAQYGGHPLPKRAVLWETAPGGAPIETSLGLPASVAWIKNGEATNTSAFNLVGDPSRRVFTLFESDTEPKAGDPLFISGLTPPNAAAPGAPFVASAGRPVALPWALGIAGAVLFFWMLSCLAWTGHSVRQARDLMAGATPIATAAYLAQLDPACKTLGGPECDAAFDRQAASPDPRKAVAATTACVQTPTNGASPLHKSAFCQLAWSVALAAANSGQISEFPQSLSAYIAAVFGWPAQISQRTGALSLAFPMAGLLVAVALIGIALGLGTTGQVFGVWISPENRISLARMQVSLWTIVVLGAYASLALFNTGMLAQSIRSAEQGAGQQSLLETLVTFPSVPSAILAALGIAVASPMLSALIKGDVGSTPASVAIDLAGNFQSKDVSGAGRFIDKIAGDGAKLENREAVEDASLADLFLGETNESVDRVDVSRLQNVLITFILISGYATLLFGIVREITPEDIIEALNGSRSLFPSLPSPGGVFPTLLALSHGTYLVSKAASK